MWSICVFWVQVAALYCDAVVCLCGGAEVTFAQMVNDHIYLQILGQLDTVRQQVIFYMGTHSFNSFFKKIII